MFNMVCQMTKTGNKNCHERNICIHQHLDNFYSTLTLYAHPPNEEINPSGLKM